MTTDILCGQTKHHERHAIRNELNLVFCTNYFSLRSGDPPHSSAPVGSGVACLSVCRGHRWINRSKLIQAHLATLKLLKYKCRVVWNSSDSVWINKNYCLPFWRFSFGFTFQSFVLVYKLLHCYRLFRIEYSYNVKYSKM